MGGKTNTRIKKILGSYPYLLTNMTKLKWKILLLKQTSRILIVKGLSAIEWIISNFNSVESLNVKNVKNVRDSNNHLAFLVINGYFTDNRKRSKSSIWGDSLVLHCVSLTLHNKMVAVKKIVWRNIIKMKLIKQRRY